MNKRVDVAYFVGHQSEVGDLYNVLLPNGIRNNRAGLTHVYDSTVTKQTLQQIVPGIVFPKNPPPREPFSDAPPPPEAIAYAIY